MKKLILHSWERKNRIRCKQHWFIFVFEGNYFVKHSSQSERTKIK